MDDTICGKGCLFSMINNSVCNPECDVSQCDYDGNDCKDLCAPRCYPNLLNNSVCDLACNTMSCDYDSDECLCSFGCYPHLLGNGKCNSLCDETSCYNDYGDCNSKNITYVQILTIIGFIVIVSSFCLIFIVICLYIRKQRNNQFSRVSNQDIGRSMDEINQKLPEISCPGELSQDICVVCLEQ
jgi:LNR domain